MPPADSELEAKGSNMATVSYAPYFPGKWNAGNRPAGTLLSSGNVALVVSGASKGLWYNTFTCCGSFSGWTGSNGIDPGLIAVP